jgi:hypothetical protein
MNNFILFHKFGKLPNYLFNCIKQIQHTQKNYTIHLLTDNLYENINNVNIININDIDIDYLKDINFYKHDNNPLWSTSFERFFYIKEYILKSNINNIFHFDNDVLIYYDVDTILPILQQNIAKIGLTQHKINEMVCGFMYIKDKNSLIETCSWLFNLAKCGVNTLTKKFENDMPHEMRLLGHIFHKTNEITPLPVTPFDDNFAKYNYVFDPSTYGQYFYNNTVHPNNYKRLADQYIVNKTILPFFDYTKKLPFLKIKDQQIPIFNLHIHSKNLQDFSSF